MRPRKFPFYWIDAFAGKKLAGNPCAVILDCEPLAAEEMLAITREMNLSETAFVSASRAEDYSARYFTVEGELPFAGHPTVAVAHALVKSGRLPISGGAASFSLALPAGTIPVEVEALADGSSRVSMVQLAPRFLRTYEAGEVLPAFGLEESDLLPGARIQTVSTGSAVLLVPLASQAALRRLRYASLPAYRELRAAGDFLFPHHFVLGGATSRGSTFARSLGMPPSEREDPFTGSATGCMAAYLWRHGFLGEPRFLAEQGHWLGRPGEAEVEVLGPRDSISGIRLAGRAELVVSGQLEL